MNWTKCIRFTISWEHLISVSSTASESFKKYPFSLHSHPTSSPVFLRYPSNRQATHMEVNFADKQGSGIDRLLPNVPKDCVELIKAMLVYDPEERISSTQALRHEYFKELWDQET